MKNPFCIKISCPRIVDRRSSCRQDLSVPEPSCGQRSSSGSEILHAPLFGHLGRPVRVVRGSRATRALGPPSSSSDSSLQICLVSSCCERSFQSPVAARHRVSVEMHNYIELRYKLC